MENHLQELEWKESNDRKQPSSSSVKRVSAEGPVIVGAGPSGLAVAACLKERGIPSVILERSNCIASLWQHRTYDRLHLHLPKKFCQLPLFPFPSSFPTYPTKQHFIAYLDSYARHFGLNPSFNTTVVSAGFDGRRGCWAVKALTRKEEEVVEYASRWLIVATGENAEAVVPEIDGMDDFIGEAVHSSWYKSGVGFKDKRVLVVGCGNSGMEVCLDLCNHNAHPSLVVRDAVHVLPQNMLGTSTFGLSMCLLKWLPIRVVDRFLLLVSRLMLGDTARLGLSRPAIGPMQWKDVSGKTPVLDIGTLEKITAGNIKVFPEIKKMTRHGAEFVDGRTEEFDAIIFATGYRSNVSYWLKRECNMLSGEKDGFPVQSFPDGGWKGENGLYAVGFAKRGLPGASLDARRIADDIERTWKSRETRRMDCICGHARIVPVRHNHRGVVELGICDN